MVAQEGDTVAEFHQICEVQSDKAAVEITSQYAGIIRELLHQPGDMVQVCTCSTRPELYENEAEVYTNHSKSHWYVRDSCTSSTPRASVS